MLKQRPDAVFIANYLMTVGFMEALRHTGCAVRKTSPSSPATTIRGSTRSRRG